MTTLRNLLLGAVSATIAMTVAGAAAAQSSPATGSATISATIQSPITVATTSNLVFGTIIKPQSGSSTVAITAAGPSALSGGAVRASGSATPTPAVFTVTTPAGTKITPNTTVEGTITTLAGWAFDASANPNGTQIVTSAATHQLKYGGSFTVSDATANGVYAGTISLTVNYE
ncbi:DUF4402 domain-containing protein [Phenylobacterium deserti]|uniref:DUF4402 domain-containing protein n=1 Tax=Phenylobacterium deserti TaxID=1914756 RepID=A0A328A9N5_9CAUL|nr:DUF4402 domain-containing protein [Phenylobacterium deserti]RAK50856.1 hypothetical protein DJ018_16925 [Phenylobacterium deserti]